MTFAEEEVSGCCINIPKFNYVIFSPIGNHYILTTLPQHCYPKPEKLRPLSTICHDKRPKMNKNRLAKLLLEEDRISSQNNQEISKFGLEQITNIHKTIEQGLLRYAPHLFSEMDPYDPLVEIAKLSLNSQDDNLKFKCHSKLAEYKYPQVKSIEINAKEDKEVRISIEIAGYAQGPTSSTDTEPEDIEMVDETEQQSYVEKVLGSGKDIGR